MNSLVAYSAFVDFSLGGYKHILYYEHMGTYEVNISPSICL